MLGFVLSSYQCPFSHLIKFHEQLHDCLAQTLRFVAGYRGQQKAIVSSAVVAVVIPQIGVVIAYFTLFSALARIIIGQIAFVPFLYFKQSFRVVLPYFSILTLIIFSSY